MHVTVGPFRYRVKLVHGPVHHEGRTCYGLCDNLQHLILISDLPHEQQRLQVFFHELMHAWWYHFGDHLDSEEATVDLIGLAMTGFTTQLVEYLRGACGTARPAGARAMTAFDDPAAAPPARITQRQDAGWTIRVYEPMA